MVWEKRKHKAKDRCRFEDDDGAEKRVLVETHSWKALLGKWKVQAQQANHLAISSNLLK